VLQGVGRDKFGGNSGGRTEMNPLVMALAIAKAVARAMEETR